MKLDNIVIGGAECAVEVSEYGRFTIRDPDGWAIGHGDTLVKAKAEAAPKIAARKVKINLEYFDEDTLLPAVITGRHAKNGNLLRRINGKSEQITSHSRGNFGYRHDTPPEAIERLHQLRGEISKLESERMKLDRTYRVDLGRAAREAIDAAMAAKASGGAEPPDA